MVVAAEQFKLTGEVPTWVRSGVALKPEPAADPASPAADPASPAA